MTHNLWLDDMVKKKVRNSLNKSALFSCLVVEKQGIGVNKAKIFFGYFLVDGS